MIGIRSRTAVLENPSPVKADRGIAPDIDAELVGLCQLGAHCEAKAVAELGGLCPSRCKLKARLLSRTATAGRADCRRHG